jgi:putative transposase
MAVSIPGSPRRDSRNVQKIVDAFLGGEGLPFAEVLSAERIERIFEKHGCLFGLHGVYTTALVVWAFLSQVLRDGKEASCQAAVARVVGHCQLQALPTPTHDTGDYCRARAKLPSAAPR